MNDLSNQEPKKVGRPSGYTKEIGWYICTQLSEGKSLRNILNGMTGVSMSMVMRWLNDERYREFREQYTRAREAQAEIMADEIKDIADDDPMEEWMTKAGKVVRRDSAGVNRNRLRVDARKWVAAKLLPKKYGDHLTRISQMKLPFEYNKASFGHTNKGFSSLWRPREGGMQWVKGEKTLFGWFLILVSSWSSMARRSLPMAG